MIETYYIGESKVKLDFNKLRRVDNGDSREGFVYQYGSIALKIYPFLLHYSTNKYNKQASKKKEQVTTYLKSFDLKRFTMPIEPIHKRWNFYIGSSMKLIKKPQKHSEIQVMTIDDLIRNTSETKTELEELSNNHVAVTDVGFHNFMYDGNFNFIDCMEYSILEDAYKEISFFRKESFSKWDKTILSRYNKEQVEFLITQLICNYSQIEYYHLQRVLSEFKQKYRNPDLFISDYLEEISEKHQLKLVKDIRRYIRNNT